MLRFTLCEEESDIDVIMERIDDPDIESKMSSYLSRLRKQLKDHILKYPEFKTTLEPIVERSAKEPWIDAMYAGSQAAGVGPMASVAGIIAQQLGIWISNHYGPIDYMIENGGDIFLFAKQEKIIQIFAGESILSDKIRFKVRPEQTPIGICTSAGTVGPSLSFGIADAVVVLAKDNALADAVATRLGNEVTSAERIQEAIEIGKNISGIEGIVIIQGEKLGIWGAIELV